MSPVAEETSVELLQREIQPVCQRASAITIKTAADRTNAKDFLLAIKQAKDRVNTIFGPMVDAAHKAWKKATETRGSLLTPLETAEKTVKATMLAYDQEQERLRLEEQRRLQAIERERAERERLKAEQEAAKQKEIQRQAEEKAAEARRQAEEASEAERKRLLAQAEAAERKAAAAAVKVEEKQEQAASVVEHVVTVSGPEKQTGESTRKRWKAKLTDKTALIAAAAANDVAASLLTFDQSAADRLATATKGAIKIQGIEWYTENILAVRGGKE